MIKKIILCLALIATAAYPLKAAEVKGKLELEGKAGINDFFYGNFSGSNPHRFDDPAAALGVHYWFNNHLSLGGEYNWSKLALSNDKTGLNKHEIRTDLFTVGLLLKYRILANSNWNFTLNTGAAYLFYDLDVKNSLDPEYPYGVYSLNELAVPFGVSFNYMFHEMFALNLGAQTYTTFKDRVDGYTLKNPDFLDDYEGYLNLTAGLSMYLETDRDKDHDGISNSKDKCPEEAEDKDGFEDEDGCPDLDNDQDGIADLKDKAPNEAEDKDGFEDEDGAPDLDNDQDGILDTADKAPNEAEDKDGFEDEDGIPDLDNDKDGIADSADKCPNEAEVVNGFKDEDGCPDVVLKKNDKITLNNIYFQSGKSELMPESFTELAKVEALFADNPNLVIQIEGHTDSQGNAAKNKKLSAQRAEAIKKYLVDKFGIAKAKLSAVGYGSEKPVADNKTPEGRSQNRRIEFKIIKN